MTINYINIPTGFDIFLAAGQSNQVSRYGPVDSVLDATDNRIMQRCYSDGYIRLAQDPLDHWDEGANTVGMSMTFAKRYIDSGRLEAGRAVLIIPAAHGGTGFSDGFWVSGGQGYNNAVSSSNAVMAHRGLDNRFKGILWHQGEDDSLMTQALYADALDLMISQMRAAITGASGCPFIIGDVPNWSTMYGSGAVSAALEDTPNRVANTAFVETDDLVSGGDSLHFSAASERILGGRYYDAYAALT